jgi:hypothetical protein
MVLNEYVATFTGMLKSAQKLDAGEKLELINIISVPHLKGNGGKKVSDIYRNILNSDEEIDLEVIKKDRQLLLKRLRGKVL